MSFQEIFQHNRDLSQVIKVKYILIDKIESTIFVVSL